MTGYPTLYNRIIFIEASIENAQKVSAVDVDLSFKIGAQLKSLTDVKMALADKAIQLNCNCVAEFKYGQKSRWLAIDDVAHFGSGMAMQLSTAQYDEIVAYIQKRDN